MRIYLLSLPFHGSEASSSRAEYSNNNNTKKNLSGYKIQSINKIQLSGIQSYWGKKMIANNAD